MTNDEPRPSPAPFSLVCADATAPGADDLAGYLDALHRDDCFRVDAVLKQSPCELTERVYFRGANGAEQGPYIRKYIDRAAGMGGVYRELHALRRAGRRLRYTPAVYDCHEAGEKLVVLMEHVPGETLRDLVQKTPAPERPGLAARVFPALVDAVAELHGALARPVVHRDLTPGNVVCPAQDPAALTVIDLGIARLYKPDSTADTSHFGTRPYAPPEQFGFGQTDVRTDVYALGMVLFFCLTGRDATPADRQRGFADPCVPAALRPVIVRAVALDPAQRYASACDLGRAFAHAQAGEKDGALAGDVPDERSSRMPEGVPSARSVPEPGPGDAPHAGETPARAPTRAAAPSPAPVSAPDPRGFLARVPAGAGRVWNSAVLVFYVAMFASCCSAVINPSTGNAAWPLWFLVYTYPVFLNSEFMLVAWALLDKRRICARFPALRRTWFLSWKAGLAYFTVYLVVGVVIQYVGVRLTP